MRLCIVAGARPNFIKIAPIIDQCNKQQVDYYFVNTGQHYDYNMAEVFFQQLGIRPPDYNLGVGSGSHATQVAAIMTAFEQVVDTEPTDVLLVVGDVNSTFACAFVAQRKGIHVVHVEAGLRSGNREMPEETNRILTDQISDLLLIHSDSAKDNLLREGISADRIHNTGNVMIDTLLQNLPTIDQSDILQRLDIQPGGYGLVTLHRPANVDNKEHLATIFSVLQEVTNSHHVVFPIHPRTVKMAEKFGLYDQLADNSSIHLIEPQSYFDFQKLMKEARFVLSDSGGVQEETAIYNVPCLTLRDETERPICIDLGTTELVTPDSLQAALDRVLADKRKKAQPIPLWDGKAAHRIVGTILQKYTD